LLIRQTRSWRSQRLLREWQGRGLGSVAADANYLFTNKLFAWR